ncbi:phage integrase SAM-like domain-containing protein [Jiulongibacter sediminis]|uniref:Arm DNA-binding domain-containing protein n=1 Tax=Jiulongibacter sediminis TaxID=1605367 RepID=A0A0P7CA80_9BACT|nr:phage integrase SAM-like domain-containing protein [Jiulongibacter sediminis]KPM49519.1 hypothetical protein AFM12_02635 [Jiulongibacter sediminis]TBX26562.1 hypothetical protein TK44_02640 [Jiulongibacter sediminis]
MKISFWLRPTRNNPYKSIIGRVHHNNEQKNFATGHIIHPDQWISSKQYLDHSSPVNIEINTSLSQIRADLLRVFHHLKSNKLPLSPEIIVKKYQDGIDALFQTKEIRVNTISEVLIKVHERRESKIGLTISKVSASRYRQYERNLLAYLNDLKLNPANTPVTVIDLDFCNNFIKALKYNYHFKETTANKHRQILREIVDSTFYLSDGWQMKVQTKDILRHREGLPETLFLTPDEVSTIEHQALIGRLDKVRDILLVLCDIGQHIGDYDRIVKSSIVYLDQYGNSWVDMARQKTLVPHSIMLTNRVLRIIDKYGGLQNLPRYAHQSLNSHLKDLASRCGIDKEITTKVGRKTFAETLRAIYGLNDDQIAFALGLKSTAYLKHYLNTRVNHHELQKVFSLIEKTTLNKAA